MFAHHLQVTAEATEERFSLHNSAVREVELA